MVPIASAKPKWLTARRLSAQGISLALGLWIVYAWVLSTPGLRDRNGLIKGTDFLHFYTLGLLAREHRGADLYNIPQQTQLLGQRIPEAAQTTYLPLYAPQVSLLFGPFAKLSYPMALVAWLLCSSVLYGLCVFSVWRTCPHLRPYSQPVLILALASPAFFNLIAWGQNSAIALACFTAAYLFLRGQREFAAGLALGCLVFKPQLLLVTAIVFCAMLAWRALAGAAITGAAQLLLGWAYYGTAAMRSYVHQITHVEYMLPQLEPRIEQTHCLRTFWQMLIPDPPIANLLYVFCSLLVVWMTLQCWRSMLPLSLRYSALLLATVLVSPHLTVYDLVILAPALLFVADWVKAWGWDSISERFLIALYLVYLLPLLGILARWSRVQLSVVAMTLLLWMICRLPVRLSSPNQVSGVANAR